MASSSEAVATSFDVANVVASVAVFYQADSFQHSVLELVQEISVMTSDGAFVESENSFQISWLFLTMVKVSEDLLYKSNFSETEIFKVIFVLLNELLSASVQFGYEQSNAGLTGGKTAFELRNDLSVEVFNSVHDSVHGVDEILDSSVLVGFKFSGVSENFLLNFMMAVVISTGVVFSESTDVVVVHIAKSLFPCGERKEKLLLNFGSGVSKFFFQISDASISVLF